MAQECSNNAPVYSPEVLWQRGVTKEFKQHEEQEYGCVSS
jgi:hypothetical protein